MKDKMIFFRIDIGINNSVEFYLSNFVARFDTKSFW